MKYLLIDTNIYIQCCLLELEGDGLDELKKMHKLLDDKKINLLLPEVIELEFYKILDSKVELLKKHIGEHKKNINKDVDLDDRVKKDAIEKLDDCIKDREKNKEKVKLEIKEIFSHKNTIKDNLKLTPQLFLDAYRYYFSGKKPFKIGGEIIQADCLIIETVKKFFEDKKDYELYFCSLNKNDFADNAKDKDESLSIHKDIKNKFKNIAYYVNLFRLLNNNFGADYSEKSIEKLKEKEKESCKINFTGSEVVLGHIYDTGKIIAFDKTIGALSTKDSIDLGLINERTIIDSRNQGLVFKDNNCASYLDANAVNSVSKICRDCGDYKFYSVLVDGLCNDCRSKRYDSMGKINGLSQVP